MNNVEIEDVYHHDFTTASEWEVFIARLEELIHEWKLPQRRIGPPLKHGDFINLPWDETSDKLNFADVEFRLKHFKLRLEEETTDNDCILVSEEQEDCWTQCQKDVLNASNDFVQLDQNHLEIARYYGIREFLVLVPSKKSSILDETRIKILLSSLTIAVSNARCELPAFVQAQESWQKFYLGVNVGKGSRMHLNMVHLKKIPPHCRHLTGLLSLFKQKINEGCGIQLDPVIVSVRLTYSLKDWTSSTWTQEPPDFDFLQGETLGVDELGKLPFGATFDPIKEFQLFVSWPEICENVVVDSESFSDLEPLSAPEWALQVEMVPGPACLLGEYLSNFLLLCSNPKSLTDILGDGAAYTTDNDNQSIGSAFNILTESKIPSISTVVHRATSKSRKNVEGPITEDVLLPILYFVFPDAEGKSRAAFMSSTSSVDQGTSSVGPSTAVGAGNSATAAENVSGAGNNSSIDDQWRGIKTCAVDSLVWRLAVVAAHCAYNLGGQAALAQLWHEFVQEVRFRWEKGIMLPGVGAGFPDCVRTCLLHQKLQMINCCIARKKAREEVERKVQGMDINADSSGDSEEDEFFECLNEDEGAQSRHQLLWNRPVGRLAKHPTLRLVQTGEPLYLPVTQDPVPKTEDQLEEDAQVMMQLGTDKNASEMRARLMSASLLSDMESFKAANPSAQLEDFIRWYSPRDWIEDADSNDKDEWGQTPGRLSARMLIPNNPWASTWTSAQPVPAYRQKRLFDDTREAEKVIHFLTNKRLGQVGQLLLPVLTHAALVALHEKKTSSLQGLPDVLQAIHSRLQFATKPIQQKLQLYEDIIRDMESVETLVAQMNSLQLKLSDNEGDAQDKELQAFVVQLMRGKEVSVPNGPRGALGNRISKMFADAQKAAHTSSTGGGGAGGGSSGGGNSSDSDAMYDPRSMAFKPFPAPTCKEFVLRAMAPRPSPTSIAQPQRLYVSLDKDNIRMAGAFSEDTIFY